MTEPGGYVILGEARDCHDLVEIYRLRKDALGLTHEWFDKYSGLAGGQIGKLLGDGGIKQLGPVSIPTMNCNLAVRFLVVIDERQVEFMHDRWEERERPAPPVRATASKRAIERFKPIIIREINRANAPKGGHARAAKLSPKRRRQIARRAALIRWNDVKAAAKIIKKEERYSGKSQQVSVEESGVQAVHGVDRGRHAVDHPRLVGKGQARNAQQAGKGRQNRPRGA